MKLLMENWQEYLEEEEILMEKCWPGYEKKGMKKMFGKMYPNCVKKKKSKKKNFKRNILRLNKLVLKTENKELHLVYKQQRLS